MSSSLPRKRRVYVCAASKTSQRNPKRKLISYALVVSRNDSFLFDRGVASVYQKPDPQPSLHLVRLGEKANDIPKKKATILLRDVKTVEFAPPNTDKRAQSASIFEIRTSDREYSLLALTAEEKKEFLSNLKKVIGSIDGRRRFVDRFPLDQRALSEEQPRKTEISQISR